MRKSFLGFSNSRIFGFYRNMRISSSNAQSLSRPHHVWNYSTMQVASLASCVRMENNHTLLLVVCDFCEIREKIFTCAIRENLGEADKLLDDIRQKKICALGDKFLMFCIGLSITIFS